MSARRSVAVQSFGGVRVAQPEDGSVPAVTEPMRATGPHCPPLTGRWVNHLHLPGYVNMDEPTCEDLEARSYRRPGPVGDVRSGGPIGASGRPGRAVRT
jgi:hypothetical protein